MEDGRRLKPGSRLTYMAVAHLCALGGGGNPPLAVGENGRRLKPGNRLTYMTVAHLCALGEGGNPPQAMGAPGHQVLDHANKQNSKLESLE